MTIKVKISIDAGQPGAAEVLKLTPSGAPEPVAIVAPGGEFEYYIWDSQSLIIQEVPNPLKGA